MKPSSTLRVAILLIPALGAGCRDGGDSDRSGGQVEEGVAASGLKPVGDGPLDEIRSFRRKTRLAYNDSRFDELEKVAEDVRSAKAVFGNGSWKIYQFYGSLACREDEPESMWKLHERIHGAWISAKPDSITARVAYADFLVDYAWVARGHGYADGVGPEAWKKFHTRMAQAGKELEEAAELEQKDPYYWFVALNVGKGLSWDKPEFDRVVDEAVAIEPRFFAYDLERASTLLPRWYGQPGDWEVYAEQAARRPNGLGAEIYARIVMSMRGYYRDLFRETKASWPQTRDGLKLMTERYPDSIAILSQAAMFGVLARDRTFAKESFDRLGDRYFEETWKEPEMFLRSRHWAETGEVR